jgi:hypothetical protein
MPLHSAVRTATPIVAVLALAATGPASAFARGGDGGGGGGARVQIVAGGTCGKGASSSLRLRSRGRGIETEFEVHGRAGSLWRVTVTHERQVAWRGKRRALGASHSFSVEYTLPDFSGADLVTARAVGPTGVVCSASATLPG